MSNLMLVDPTRVADLYSGVHAGTALHYADRKPITAPSQPDHEPGASDRALGTPVRIDLPHIGVVLSISVEGLSSANATRVESASLGAINGLEAIRDPIVERLFCDFDRPGDQPSRLSGVYTDAVRLAVLARCLGLHAANPEESDSKTAAAALPKWRLKRVTDYIDNNIGEPVSLADLADAAGLSKMYFAAQFRAATGIRPHEYVLRRRIDRAKAHLTETNDSLAEIAFSVGFQTQAHFTTVFKRIAGTTPGQWRGLGTRVR